MPRPKMIKRFTLILSLAGFLAAPFAGAAASALVAYADLPQLQRTSLMEKEAKLIVEMLETMHFESAEISSETFEALIAKFMEDLDYSRLYFLASDEKAFKEKYGPTLGFELRYRGNLEMAFEIYERYRAKATERIEWALAELEKDWDFKADESFVFDRRESPWPESEAEADDLWRRRLKYELLQEVLSEKTMEEAKERIVKRYERMNRSIKEFDSKDVEEAFLTSLTQMFDPHSTFFSSKTFEDFNIQMRLSLVGIGAMLSEEDGYCVVKELVPGAPAKRSSTLKPNDRIVAVAQEGKEPVDIVGMGLRKIVEMIRGEKGTAVTLTVIPAERADETARKEVTIVRDVVHINSSRASGQIYEVPQTDGTVMPIGVIEIPTFYGDEQYDEFGNRVVTSVTADVEELVIKMEAAGAKGIVLDIRHNGGGLLEEAINMTGLFIRRGPVVQVREKNGYVRPEMDRDPKVVYTGPLAVLTTRYSASASEILAGALQNYGRAIVLGNSSTHGKGTVQQVFSLDEYVLRKDLADDKAGAAKLTVRKFYLPNGFSTQRKGVVPDIQLESLEEVTAVGEGDLPNALAWDFIKPVARFVEMTLRSSLVDALRDSTLDRQNSLEEFSFHKERLAWYKEREERKEVSLNIEARKAMKEADEAFLDSKKEEQRKLAALNFPATEVKLESVIADEAKNATESAFNPEPDAPEVSAAEEPAPSESAGEETPAESMADADSDSDSEEEDDVPDFDILLRETLRIVSDAIRLEPDPDNWRQPALPLASKSRFEKLVN